MHGVEPAGGFAHLGEHFLVRLVLLIDETKVVTFAATASITPGHRLVVEKKPTCTDKLRMRREVFDKMPIVEPAVPLRGDR